MNQTIQGSLFSLDILELAFIGELLRKNSLSFEYDAALVLDTYYTSLCFRDQ